MRGPKSETARLIWRLSWVHFSGLCPQQEVGRGFSCALPLSSFLAHQ